MTSYRMTDCHKTQPPGLPCFLGDTLQAQCMLIFIYHIPEKTATFCLFIVIVVFSVFVLGSMSRRERTHISEEVKVFLQKAYKEGMTRVGSPLVGAASQATGLPPFVIDNWIGNYRRKKPSSSQPKNKKLYTKDLSGYNLFCRDQLKNKDPGRKIRTPTVEDILNAICANDERSVTEPMGLTEVLPREPTTDDTTDVCNICHCLFSDEKKNAKKKWREWRRCNTCEQWSHLACGFKKN
ncbi:uncharacterized protein LOC114148569 isoform X2 [Xiphophorus couchianus]|nr:uncharacterized protein LOC114148569 isoform X2 [Xiphophorus couchianus]